jgi:hypothetical protein
MEKIIDSLFEDQKEDQEKEFNPEYALGDVGPGGGIIFYVSVSGFKMGDSGHICHYLEAAPSDLKNDESPNGFEWATSDWLNRGIPGMDATGAPSTKDTRIGAGRQNTDRILSWNADYFAPAARACRNSEYGGKTDWFLPSRDELVELVKNYSLFDTQLSFYYWSSSQFSLEEAWIVYFEDALAYEHLKSVDSNSVRAIRAF